eukprot:6425824-Pyramimonas_sp.AAC.1
MLLASDWSIIGIYPARALPDHRNTAVLTQQQARMMREAFRAQPIGNLFSGSRRGRRSREMVHQASEDPRPISPLRRCDP